MLGGEWVTSLHAPWTVCIATGTGPKHSEEAYL